MNILVITRGKLPLPNVRGGAVEYLIQLILDENEKSWHDNYTVYSNYYEYAKEKSFEYKYCKFKYIKLDTIKAKILSFIRYIINTKIKYIGNYYISEVIKDLGETINQFDLIIDENAPDYLELLWKNYGGRIVFHSHNDWINEDNCSILNFCDEYWPISKYLASRHNFASPKFLTKVLYNGVKIEEFENYDIDLVNQFKMQYQLTDSFVFIFSGRLVKEKGVLELIRAFIKCGFDSYVKLFIVGGCFYDSDNETDYIKKCKREAEGCENIIFTGYVDSSSMKYYYRCADVGCFTSLCEEAFGLSLLEMMASELPIITTNSGAVTEIVSKEEAIIIEKDDNMVQALSKAMVLLRKNKELRIKLAENAKKRANDFSVNLYLNSYEQYLKEGKKRESGF